MRVVLGVVVHRFGLRHIACVVLLLGSPLSSIAQDQPDPRVATMNESIALAVQPGQRIVIHAADGRALRGRVLAIEATELRVAPERLWLPLFVAPESRVPLERIHRIETVDSPWNGTLMGALAAVPLVYGVVRWDVTNPPDSDGTSLVLAPLVACASVFVGYSIDLHTNRPVYARQTGPSVTISMPVQHGGVRVAARVGF